MVTRVFRNPSGVRQVQETTGTFTGSTTFAGVAPGQLYLEDSERDLLREPGQAGAGAAYSVSLLAGAQPVHSPFCSLQLGGVRCSCGANIAGRPIYENGE